MKPRENMTEAEFKNVVISIAKRYGWLIHHDLPAQNSRGKWATHVQGDAGFPRSFNGSSSKRKDSRRRTQSRKG
jgi:hypothetical protein